MPDNKALEEVYDNPIEAVMKIVKSNGKEILNDPMKFSSSFSAIAPNLKKESEIFKMVISQGIGSYFIKSDDHEASVKKATDELKKLFNDDVTDTVIESICQAVGWDEIVTTKSSPEKLFKKGEEYYNKEIKSDVGFLERLFLGKSKTKIDYENAVKWYKFAAEKGHTEAQYKLGNCYYKGYGLKKDYQKAFEWFIKAAENGNTMAQNSIGYFYENGLSVEKDMLKAICFYVKSYEGGNPRAKANLERLIFKINQGEKNGQKF